nr:ribonuclease H-like domain-containing protein [Tanacetum cinerariifolium]
YDSQGFDNQVLENHVNDKYNTGEGYHVVPPLYTGNFMPPKPDLVFANEHVVSESVTSLLGLTKSKVKTVSEPIIEDWVSDSEDENEIETETKQIKPSFAKVKFVKPTEHVKYLRKSVKQEESNRQTNTLGKTVKFLEIWRTKQKLLDHVYRHNGTSINFKRFDYVDAQGRSKHMTRNMSYLSEYEEIYGGYVAFRGDPKGGKITGKGKINTGKLDFKDVYFVKELKFNLFSVSQMYDKKNSVLFTDTKCVVLSPNFKLLDESQVLLRVPRKNNMYSVDLRNVAPSGGLTCLLANATLDESNLWHRRLRHINFKTMNKLGIRREFSVARTPQQNGVAERKNKTLIEAARTMLADSKLPTTFWAEAVNTVCYVQNKVLVVKPHNKTSYELFLGRKPALSFMRPFGCPVIILNTLNHLGPKSSEDEVTDDAGKKSTEVPRKENEVQDPAKEGDKNNQEKDVRDQEEASRKQFKQESERLFRQGEAANTNSTNILNSVSSPVNAVSSSFTTIDLGGERTQRNEFGNLPTDPLMPDLEDTADTKMFSGAYDDEVKGTVADFNNLELTTVVSPIPTTRIHKDHPKEQIIGDPLSVPQTRRMIKIS